MPAAIGERRVADPLPDDHVELFIDQPRDQFGCSGRIIGRVAIRHDIDVGIDIGEHPPHHRALALDTLVPHDRARAPRDLDRAIGRIVVVHIDRRLRQRGTKPCNGRGDRGFFVVTGQQHGNGQCHVARTTPDAAESKRGTSRGRPLPFGNGRPIATA